MLYHLKQPECFWRCEIRYTCVGSYETRVQRMIFRARHFARNKCRRQKLFRGHKFLRSAVVCYALITMGWIHRGTNFWQFFSEYELRKWRRLQTTGAAKATDLLDQSIAAFCRVQLSARKYGEWRRRWRGTASSRHFSLPVNNTAEGGNQPPPLLFRLWPPRPPPRLPKSSATTDRT